MLNLILVNTFFAGILLLFIVLPVTSNWLWLMLIFSWCWLEGSLSRNPKVKWWQMLLLFIVLAALELYLISTFSYY